MSKHEFPASSAADGQNIVLLGGGGGNAALAPGFIEALPEANFTVITGTADSGSATGRLRELYGGAAVGDLSKVVCAVSGNQAGGLANTRLGESTSLDELEDQLGKIHHSLALDGSRERMRAAYIRKQTGELAADLLRREKRGLYGHRIANLMLTAMRIDHEERGGDLGTAVGEFGSWLEARAQVLPSSITPHNLMMEHAGRILRGEGTIDDEAIDDPHGAHIWLDPVQPGSDLEMYEPAYRAIASADAVILQPGSYWTSHGAQLIIPGMKDALDTQAARGPLVAIANLVVEKDTPTFTGKDFISGLGRMAGREIDCVVYNTDTAQIPDGKVPVVFEDSHFDELKAEPIAAQLAGAVAPAEQNDPISHLRSELETKADVTVAALMAHGILRHTAALNRV